MCVCMGVFGLRDSLFRRGPRIARAPIEQERQATPGTDAPVSGEGGAVPPVLVEAPDALSGRGLC